MKQVEVKMVLERGFHEPVYASEQAAGMDVRAYISEPVTIKPMERKLIPTGIKMAIPDGYEVQVRPRSGLALKHGITVLNTPGTIDADYRGDIGVILINLGNENYIVEPNERIAQLVLNEVPQMKLIKVDTLDETERGAGGFGHTGK